MKIIYSTDDLSRENLKHFKYWDMVKESHPKLKVVAFVIVKDLDLNLFSDWYEEKKQWVEIGVHCWGHEKPQLGWRDDQEYYIKKARDVLAPFLPEHYLFRFPGFRFLPKSEKILKKLGFAGIAHQEFIKYFDTGEFFPVINTHCTFDQFQNPIGQIWQNIIKKIENE